MTYIEILNTLSKELDLPKEVIVKVYKAYWKSIKEHIQSLPLKDNINEEEIKKLKINCNIPSLGKLECSYDRLLKIKQKYKLQSNKKIIYAKNKKDSTYV